MLSPLKALMDDQVAGLQRRKLPATFINSDISGEQKERHYRLLESGALSFVCVAPERFSAKRVRPQAIEPRRCRSTLPTGSGRRAVR